MCAQLLSQLQPTRLLYPWDSPGKNTGVGCLFLLEGIFLTQGSNLSLFCFLHCGWILYPEPPGKPPDPQPWEIYKLENSEKETEKKKREWDGGAILRNMARWGERDRQTGREIDVITLEGPLRFNSLTTYLSLHSLSSRKWLFWFTGQGRGYSFPVYYSITY